MSPSGFIADQLILPLRDETQNRDPSLKLIERAVPRVVRVVHRQRKDDELGHYEEIPEDRGDLVGWGSWRVESTNDRDAGAGWSTCFPSVIVGRERVLLEASGPTEVFEVLPVRTKDWTEDERFKPKKFPDDRGECWPVGTRGIVGAGTEENSQEDVFLPCDRRLVAVNYAGDPMCSSIVYDLTKDNEFDEARNAPLHSAWRVVRPRPGRYSFPVVREALAWQLGRSGRDAEEGLGLCYDLSATPLQRLERDEGATVTAQGATRTVVIQPPVAPSGVQIGIVAAAGVKGRGPLDVGEIGDPHEIGRTEDGERINSLHLSTDSIWRGKGGDAPAEFQAVRYTKPAASPVRVRTHLRYDTDAKHEFFGEELDGLWRWESESVWNVPPVITPPPTGEPPIITTQPPKVPGQPLTIPGGGSGGGGGSSLPLPYENGPARQRVDGEPPEPLGETPLPAAAPAFLGRVGTLDHDGIDVRKHRAPSFEAVEDRLDRAPVVYRIEAYGGAVRDEPVYTVRPGSARYRGGTGPGGMVFLPPEMDVKDACAQSTPDDCSTAYQVFVPDKGRLAFGWPDCATGGVTSGWEVYADSSSDLQIDRTSDNTTGVPDLDLDTGNADTTTTDFVIKVGGTRYILRLYAELTETQVADYEDATEWSVASSGGGAPVLSDDAGEAQEGTYAMKIAMDGTYVSGDTITATFDAFSGPSDWSSYTSVTFDARGATSTTIKLKLTDGGATSETKPLVTFLSDVWATDQTFALSGFTTVDLTDITDVEFEISRTSNGAYNAYLDDLRLTP